MLDKRKRAECDLRRRREQEEKRQQEIGLFVYSAENKCNFQGTLFTTSKEKRQAKQSKAKSTATFFMAHRYSANEDAERARKRKVMQREVRLKIGLMAARKDSQVAREKAVENEKSRKRKKMHREVKRKRTNAEREGERKRGSPCDFITKS